MGLEIEKKTYSVSQDGNNVTALLQLNKKQDGKICCLGWRNSLDMKWSVGFFDVLTVTFCTNQITRGSIILLRKHTSGLSVEQLSILANNAVSKVVSRFDSLNVWHESLRSVALGQPSAERLTIQAMREEVLQPNKFKEFDSLLFGESASYDMNLYGFHGALTQLIRERHLRAVLEDNTRISGFVDRAKAELSP
jgi:hypothetical protein